MHTLRKQSCTFCSFVPLVCVYLTWDPFKIFSSTQLDLNTLNSNKRYKPFYFFTFYNTIPDEVKVQVGT